MKRILLVILVSLFAAVHSDIAAQTIDQAQERHRQLNMMRMGGSSENEIFATLHQCYKDYMAVLESEMPGSMAYEAAKSGILDIHPLFINGAAFYQKSGIKQNMAIFAQAYVDVAMMDAFRNEQLFMDEQFSSVAYLAASTAYNTRQYEKAVNYFAAYLGTGDKRNREDVYVFMANACLGMNNIDLALSVLEEGISQYPQNFGMLSTAINCCIEQKDDAGVQRYLTKALALRPNDEQLLKMQGKLYEDNQEFDKALDAYVKLNALDPNRLSTMEHIALNYYNLGVINFNKVSLQDKESDAQLYSAQADAYFGSAVNYMEHIISTNPTSVKYLQALAVSYDCLGKVREFEMTNQKLANLGAATVEANVTPTLTTHSAKALTSTKAHSNKTNVNNNAANSNVLRMLSQHKTEYEEMPKYSVYAKDYVESSIKAWQEKDPYETVAEYQKRVNEDTRNAKIKELLQTAESNYIKTYAGRVRIEDMTLKPYDADHEVFLVESQYGEIIVPVPRDKNEARIFESSWNGMQIKDPEFYISNDKMLLSGLTFVTPTGVSYRYDGKKDLDYTETVIDVSFDDLDSNMFASSSKSAKSKVKKQTLSVEGIMSDVDTNIPEIGIVNENRYALIIANENYERAPSDVKFAIKDGETFAEYCEKTLGIPKNQVLFEKNVGYVGMIGQMDKIKNLARASNGNMELIFFYAGHGFPDEVTKDAYLLPVDASETQLRGCYRLKDIYNELASLNAKSVTVFLDACFSGGTRDGGMLMEARGVAIKPKDDVIPGNLVVFSAVSNAETSMAYDEKGHGLFTYFLLKKIQESKGDVTLEELSKYLKQHVTKQSILVNDKPQNPTVMSSSSMSEMWRDIKLGGK